MATAAGDPRHAKRAPRPSVESFDEVVSRALRILDEESRAWTESPERLAEAHLRRTGSAPLINPDDR